MRKILFFPVILALCVVNFASFGATTSRSSRGTGSTTTTSTSETTPNTMSVAARAAATRSAIKAVNNASVSSARSATTTAKAPAVSARSAKTKTSAVTARAGTTKKVISTGTKVEVAKENTVVSQECQDAYYGCMDAFCMLDNASGGRCQCSDRNAELDSVLEEILQLDEQSYALATEGVERIQMGDNADVIMSRAKAAADKVAKDTLESKAKETAKKRTLDLSAWNTNLFSDDEDDEDIFGDSLTTMETKFANKKGDDLHNAAAKLCTRQLPEQCSSAGGILQLTYAQKVRSDCSAYENSLRQQRNSSKQKLQTAQKALRDAALEVYENENKYDLGQCVIQYKQCLQTTAECGTDFSGCIADTAILQALYGGGKGSKSGTIPTTAVKTGVTTITISSATYDILNSSKREMCQHVTKQCVNANKNDAVWKTVLKEIAPAVYTAEYSAASNSRMNCISTAVSCVQKVCGSQWDENSDNYDACLSDPDLVAASCKLELARCGGVGDTVSVQDKVWNYVKAKLAAIRVDKCTQEVKECLLSEDRCGPDYSACIGLDTDTIVDFCVSSAPQGQQGSAADKLIACQTKYDPTTVRDYVARVAQGLALNIDNTFAQTCQNAAEAAMQKVCGISTDDEDSDGTCPGLILSNAEVKNSFKWQYCRKGTEECVDELSAVTDEDVEKNNFAPRLTGRLEMAKIRYSKSGKQFVRNEQVSVHAEKDGYTDTDDAILLSVIAGLNRDYASVLAQVDADPTIKACTEGKEFQMISTSDQLATESDDKYENYGETKNKKSARYNNLMLSTYSAIADQMLSSVFANYNTELASVLESGQRDEMYDALRERMQQIIAARIAGGTAKLCGMNSEEYALFVESPELIEEQKRMVDESNSKECLENVNWNREPDFSTNGKIFAWWTNLWGNNTEKHTKLITVGTSAEYDSETNTCIVTINTYQCERTRWLNASVCKVWDTEKPIVTQQKYIMSEFKPSDLRKDCPDWSGGSGGASVNPDGSGTGGSSSGGSGSGGGLFGRG